MRKLLLGLLLCSVGFGAVADWKYSEKVDEMRGTTQYFASLAPEKDNEGVAMILGAYSDNNQDAYDIKFMLNGAKFDCMLGSICSGSMKLNNENIVEFLFETDKEDGAIATHVWAAGVATSVLNSEVVYLEVPIKNEGMMQFKYHPKGLKWSM
ncbi:hypothetical protein J0A78_05570 [Providencia rettgeri]|uniref:hypothetical protein n=1 Tax=Providencia rettgeri TaxID=587 RepID=UPI0019D41955|nr:hypothetical protein [Providencia rettgeri]MBN7841142.1 hypothetical protein [Providencia rettgeri]MBN7852701.1 hypothetical protein [Providencia rettgeri]MBN7862418.1 hypothetical protein [Providencia rettgeri]MBN7871969.1 hypothetical protein [Providencia rettgeri]MBN7895278.1 hypothetical protein [Providencia rettgeri]